VTIAVVASVLFIIGMTQAATTISTDITTGGNIYATSTLLVDGNATFNDDGSDNDFRIEGDTVTNAFVVDGGLDSVGIASTTPWGLLSVEAVQGTVNTDTPIFVVGDQGTSTPLFMIDGNGSVGIGTSTPSAVGLSVVGDGYFTSGLGVGHVETTDGRLTVLTDAGIGTTSASAVGLSVVGDGYFTSGLGVGEVSTTDGRLLVLTDFGLATTSPAEEFAVTGDGYFGSAATTTLHLKSTGATQGGCIELEGADDVIYRISINPAGNDVEVVAGTCQG